jgi:hypothetical protein
MTTTTNSCESNSRSASQELPRYHGTRSFMFTMFKKSKLLVPIPIQMNQVHTSHPISFEPISRLSFYLLLGLPSGLFPLGFITKNFRIEWTAFWRLLHQIKSGGSAKGV